MSKFKGSGRKFNRKEEKDPYIGSTFAHIYDRDARILVNSVEDGVLVGHNRDESAGVVRYFMREELAPLK